MYALRRLTPHHIERAGLRRCLSAETTLRSEGGVVKGSKQMRAAVPGRAVPCGGEATTIGLELGHRLQDLLREGLPRRDVQVAGVLHAEGLRPLRRAVGGLAPAAALQARLGGDTEQS